MPSPHTARRGASRSKRVALATGAAALLLGSAVTLTVLATGADSQADSIQELPQVTSSPAAPVTGPARASTTAVRVVGAGTTATARLRIAVAGDVGTGGVEEVATADAMDRLEGTDEYAALLMLGDNVYEDGDPSRLGPAVFEPFAGVLDGKTRLLAVLGNHDVDSGFGDAQAAGLGMPAAWYATRFADALVIALDSNRPNDPNQLDFLERSLAASTETWKIVIFHHPPYSGGAHGSDMAVRDAFVPLFEQYGVQLVLTGHDHDYQRSEQINGVTYVVSGAAAKLRDTQLADFSVVAQSTFHFVDLEVSADRLVVRAIDQSGGEIDSVTLTASPMAGGVATAVRAWGRSK